ncbi:MAG: hypothetical protein WCF99_13335 [Chloroflexales bacterium]
MPARPTAEAVRAFPASAKADARRNAPQVRLQSPAEGIQGR